MRKARMDMKMWRSQASSYFGIYIYIYIYIYIFFFFHWLCGLWPVEQCPSIFSYLPPTLSIFSLPAFEDLLLLPLSIFFLGLPLLLVPSSS